MEHALPERQLKFRYSEIRMTDEQQYELKRLVRKISILYNSIGKENVHAFLATASGGEWQTELFYGLFPHAVNQTSNINISVAHDFYTPYLSMTDENSFIHINGLEDIHSNSHFLGSPIHDNHPGWRSTLTYSQIVESLETFHDALILMPKPARRL